MTGPRVPVDTQTLRDLVRHLHLVGERAALIHAAADEIDARRDEVARLRGALERAADRSCARVTNDYPVPCGPDEEPCASCVARAALGKGT